MIWTPAEIAVAVGWGLNAEMLVVLALARFLPFRLRRLVSYLIATLILLCLWQWRHDDPDWQFELIVLQALTINVAVMYFLKAWLIQVRNALGRALAVNNYALAGLFVLSQVWLLWNGGTVETALHYLSYLILLYTVNVVITELLVSTERRQ